MDDEASQNSKPIGTVLGVFMTMLFLIADVISFIPGAGDVEDIAGVFIFILGFISQKTSAAMSTTLGIVIFTKAIRDSRKYPHGPLDGSSSGITKIIRAPSAPLRFR